MKKIIISMALLTTPLVVWAAPNFSPNNNFGGFNTPWGNNNRGFNNGSSWNMPNMNWGNGNGYNNGSSWNMPNFNWGSNNGYSNGSNWNMPRMNWGGNNGYGNGSGWNMPNFNNGNGFNKGSNWNMPGFNSNNNRPWNYGNNTTYRPNYPVAPNVRYRAPVMPTPPTLIAPPAPLLKKQIKPAIQAAPQAMMNAPKPAIQTPFGSGLGSETTLKVPVPNDTSGLTITPANETERPVEEALKAHQK